MGGPSQGGNVFEQAAQNYTRGTNTAQQTVNPMAVPFSMNQFLNPYTDLVTGNALQRLRDDRNIALNQVQAQANQQNAFGGARHGLVESQIYDNYNQNAGDLAAQLYGQGFNTAAGFGLQRLDQQLAGAGLLNNMATTGFGLGNQVLQQQNAAGMQQQQLMQQILDQGTRQVDANINYPQQALATALAGVQGNPLAAQTTATRQHNPGLLSYLSLGAGLGSAYLGNPYALAGTGGSK